MASHANAGKKALEAKDWSSAITHYTHAIADSPTSPDYLIQRSTAYQRAGQYPEALRDAENAVLAAQKRAKREAIVEAQFRRGVACYSLERYGDAEFLFKLVERMDGKHKMVKIWQGRVAISLKDLGDGGEKAVCNIKETPEAKSEAIATNVTNGTATATNGHSTCTSAQPSPTPAPQQTPADKIRHEWYQNTQNIYLTLLAKGVPADKASIDITARSLSISFPLITGSSYDLTLEPLYADVVPEKCIKRIMSTKVEVILVKKVEGEKWKSLESTEPPPTKLDTPVAESKSDAVKQAVLNPTSTTAPSYPTSSKHGPKDWDKVTKEAAAELRDPAKAKDGEDEDDYEGGDEANAFFKKLFKNASPDVQRAMMKSYQESNGTALSTNWDEVSKGPVETHPPDGMQARKWGE
ncbi:hypothetical protein BAUCODRAFT_36587 [Baudoinia panamericana UAMH 10762]|uniref:SGS-domain-containing protein n=1 Tax=Baudoinia panamericana (strain UAMH 10762) TaxID=717646 RepID=M2N512_BAUPA|nr:uncharacterized protein BAUCODRAFT_36587 [Baudoinia panamericana UAMH 10762]EMC94114.1 hypothetical protein BAUCODRAFT_36587 [Baudoinia panamericana UAMH 10762]